MKKIVKLLLIALCVSPMVMAQSYDDLYYNPNKKDTSVRKEEKKNVSDKTRTNVSTNVPVVVKDRKGNVRNVDEYNRRYDARDNDFKLQDDTLYVEEKQNPERGEWVNGFNGSQDDYEYAQRIIRFHNPRFAVSISSPYYWDIVYGLNSWDWNVYTDDYYAYAFPTFTNRYWWDWRFNSFGYNWGWNSWNWGYPYYGGFYSGYWGGYYGGSWGYPYYGHGGYPWYGGGYGGHWNDGYYTNRRSIYNRTLSRVDGANVRTSAYSRLGGTQDRSSVGTRRSSMGRVIGTRSDDYSGVRRSGYIRSEATGFDRGDGISRRTYTRPSSTRTYDGTVRESSYSRSESIPTRSSSYSRGSSAMPRSYSSGENSYRRSSSDNMPSSRSYSPSSNSSRSSSFSGGGSSRSSSSSSSSSSGGSSRSSGGRR